MHFDITALGIPAALFLARQVEDYIVVPKVIGHAVELHPLAVIFAVLVGEHMAGALGMLIAIPVAASVKLILDSSYPPDPGDHEEPKQHGGALAWLVTKFKGNPLDRKPEPQTAEQVQEEATVEWAHTKNEVTNEKLAQQMSGLQQDIEAQEIKEAALIKLEEKKRRVAEEKAHKSAAAAEAHKSDASAETRPEESALQTDEALKSEEA